LLVGLASTTCHLGAGESAGSALAGIGKLAHDGAMQEVSGGRLPSDLEVKGGLATFLALPITN
jgi:hypothetical protein